MTREGKTKLAIGLMFGSPVLSAFVTALTAVILMSFGLGTTLALLLGMVLGVSTFVVAMWVALTMENSKRW